MGNDFVENMLGDKDGQLSESMQRSVNDGKRGSCCYFTVVSQNALSDVGQTGDW